MESRTRVDAATANRGAFVPDGGLVGRPEGTSGRLLAWVMSLRNRRMNDVLVELLELREEDRVLEIGFGHGSTLGRIASHAPRGFVAGVDHAAAMVDFSKRRNARHLREGRMDLRLGTVSALPFPDQSFDKACACNSLPFWSNPEEGLQELHRVLKHDGLLVLGLRMIDKTKLPRREAMRPDQHAARERVCFKPRELEELLAMLERAGYTGVQLYTREQMLDTATYVSARRGAAR